MKNKLVKVSLIILILAGLTVSFVFLNQPNSQVLAEGVGDTWNKVWNSSDIGTVSSIAVDDVDGDGTNEIVVGTLNNVDSSVYTYTYHGYVYVFNALTHELEWQSSDIGYVYNVVVTDLDGDDRKEIIALVKYGASAVIGYRYGFVYVFDGATHEQKWKSHDIGSYGDLVVEDLDGDGTKEIIASGDYYYSCTRYGNIYVFNGSNFTQKWMSENIPRAHEIVVADADDDGVKEIVVGNSVNDCAGYYPGNVYVFDGVNFTQEWISGDIGMVYANSLVVDDVDKDGVKEISAGVRRTWYPSKGYIYVFDGKTHAQEWQSPMMDSLLNLKVDDVDNDKTKEIIVRTDINFRVFDGQIHTLEWESSNMGYNLDLEVDDVDNDGVKEILTRNTSSGNGYLSIFNGLTHEEEWRSEDIGVGGGKKSLIVVDIDNDGWKEIVAGGGKELHHGNLYIFALATSEPPPENQPPTCAIELRKNGEKIDTIDVGEPFDIVFTNYSGNIDKVKFSSDDSQDGTTTGTWTKDYDWATSSEDWDGSGKIKKWSFSTPGIKEVWAEVKNDVGQTGQCSKNIKNDINKYAPTLRFDGPDKDTIPLCGSIEDTLNKLNNVLCLLPNLDCCRESLDEPYYPVDWNFDKDDYDVSNNPTNYVKRKLSDNQKPTVFVHIEPDYEVDYDLDHYGTLNPLSLPKQYYAIQYWYYYVYNDWINNHNHDWVLAMVLLNRNTKAPEYLYLQYHSFSRLYAWSEVEPYLQDGTHPMLNVQGGSHEFLSLDDMQGDREPDCRESGLCGITYSYKGSIKKQDGEYDQTPNKFGDLPAPWNMTIWGRWIWPIDESNRIVDGSFPPSKLVIPILLKYGLLKYVELNQPLVFYLIKSPGELRVYDSQGRITGLVNGEVKEEIPNSIYDAENKAVVIFEPFDTYRYEVVGTDTGTYELTITSVENGTTTTFTATDIPITPGQIHQYSVGWDALSRGEKGVNLQIDADGDGIFEQTINSDATLEPPVANAGGPYEGSEGFPINFDGSNSTDTDGIIVLYEWDFDGDGIYDASSTYATTTHTWGDDFQGEVALRVTDDEGLTDTATTSIIVNNVPPTANAGPDQSVTAGDIVHFSGTMTDPGWLDTHTYEWDFDSSNGIQADATGQTPTHIYYNAGVYTVTLTVTDDDRGVGTDTLIVEVKPIPATIDCDPDTLNLKSKGEWITCYIELPAGYDVRKIDAATILLNGVVTPELDPKYGFVKSEDSYIVDHDGDGILERMVKFDRAAVQAILSPGEAVALTITGKVFYNLGLTDFEGLDIIRVIAPAECNNCNPNPSANGKK